MSIWWAVGFGSISDWLMIIMSTCCHSGVTTRWLSR